MSSVGRLWWDGSALRVRCGDGWVRVRWVQAAGKRVMGERDFVNGQRISKSSEAVALERGMRFLLQQPVRLGR